LLSTPLRPIRLGNGKIKASVSFGVLSSGRLVAHCYNEHGASIGTMPLVDVNPTEVVSLETEILPPAKPARLSLHLEDENGLDRGALQELQIAMGDNR